LLAVATAARRGELVALKDDAVDLDAGTVTVRASLANTRATKAERAAGAPATILKGTKSGKPRSVPLDADALGLLRRLKAERAAAQLLAAPGTYRNEGFVFADRFGQRVKLGAPTKAFRDIADAAGLPKDLTLHSLRHSFASWAFSRGADIVAVQRVMGHSVPSTTLNLYASYVEGGREKAVAAVGDAPRSSQASALTAKK
jgi:integrase